MEIWIPGVLALIGALSGVLLTTYLARATKRSDARRERLEEALRCVVLAITAQNFSTWIGMTNQPDFVSEDDVHEVERKMYVQNLEKNFLTIREARHAVALLVADGIDVGDTWRVEEAFARDLEAVYARLRNLLGTKAAISGARDAS